MAIRMGIDKVQQTKDTLTRLGSAEGVQFKFGGRIGNTRDSHRLIAMAGKKGPEVQGIVAEELFRGYYEEEQDITSHEFLIRAAKAAGLDGDEIRGGLEGNECGREVDEEVEAVKLNGTRGVPQFSITSGDMQREISGAQDTSEWMETFTAAKEAEAAS